MDIFFYHITKEKYINNILTYGLKINSSKNGFVRKSYIDNYYKKYGLQPIFLTNDVNYIIKTQLTDKFIKNCWVLKINCENLLIEDEFDYLNDKWNLYYMSKEAMMNNIFKYKGKSFVCKTDINKNLIYKYRKIL